MKSKIIFTAIALVCLIGAISVASAEQATTISWGHNPAIYGSKDPPRNNLSTFLHCT